MTFWKTSSSFGVWVDLTATGVEPEQQTAFCVSFHLNSSFFLNGGIKGSPHVDENYRLSHLFKGPNLISRAIRTTPAVCFHEFWVLSQVNCWDLGMSQHRQNDVRLGNLATQTIWQGERKTNCYFITQSVHCRIGRAILQCNIFQLLHSFYCRLTVA